MKSTQIIILVVVLAVIGLAIGFSKGGNSTQTLESETITASNDSVIVVEDSSYDFGEIDIFGGKVTSEYILINTGEQDVVVTSATTSCGCTEGEIGGESFGMHFAMSKGVTIPAGESMPVKAIYDPLAHGPDAVGPVTRMMMLQTNSTATPSIEVRLTANVIKNETNE